MKYIYFLIFSVILSSCGNADKGKDALFERGKATGLNKVSYYSDDSIIAATYFSKDTNWSRLAEGLWKEKTKLVEGKDSAVTYFLIVFNDLAQTPDITTDHKIAWNEIYLHYRSCILDNSQGFTRFCYGVRYDEGRVGDWKGVRMVNPDGTLAEEL